MGTRALDDAADLEAGRVTIGDLLQLEQQGLAVPVRVRDSVQVQQLPTSTAISKNVISDATTAAPVKLLNEDARRARASIMCTGAAVFIGTDPGAVAAKTAFRLPVDQLLTITGREAWYVLAEGAVDTGIGTATVSAIVDQWTV